MNAHIAVIILAACLLWGPALSAMAPDTAEAENEVSSPMIAVFMEKAAATMERSFYEGIAREFMKEIVASGALKQKYFYEGIAEGVTKGVIASGALEGTSVYKVFAQGAIEEVVSSGLLREVVGSGLLKEVVGSGLLNEVLSSDVLKEGIMGEARGGIITGRPPNDGSTAEENREVLTSGVLEVACARDILDLNDDILEALLNSSLVLNEQGYRSLCVEVGRLGGGLYRIRLCGVKEADVSAKEPLMVIQGMAFRLREILEGRYEKLMDRCQAELEQAKSELDSRQEKPWRAQESWERTEHRVMELDDRIQSLRRPVVSILGASAAPSATSARPGVYEERFDTTSHHIRYLLSLPESYDVRGQPSPLILFLHGAGQRGDDLGLVSVHGPSQYAAQHSDFPFVIVSPQCPADQWWPQKLETVKALLDDVLSRYNIDRRRVYLTGLSMGGFAAWQLACAYPHYFAAVVPVCGGGLPYLASRLQHVGVWAFHGDKDPTVPVACSEEMVQAVQAVGGDAQLTIYPDAGHDAWTAAYNNPELYAWLLQHHTLNRPTPPASEPL